jgi:hypothetical protein
MKYSAQNLYDELHKCFWQEHDNPKHLTTDDSIQLTAYRKGIITALTLLHVTHTVSKKEGDVE